MIVTMILYNHFQVFVREPTTSLSVELDCHFPAGCEKATSEWFQPSRKRMKANHHFMICQKI